MLQIQKVYMDPKTSAPDHPQKALPAKDPTSALEIFEFKAVGGWEGIAPRWLDVFFFFPLPCSQR